MNLKKIMSDNFQDRSSSPKLKLNSPTAPGKKSADLSRKGLGIFFFFSLLVTALGGYFLVREIQLKATRKLIQDCEGQENCPGRMEAVERLVKVKRSLRAADLSQARLYFAQFSGAQLPDANLQSAKLSSADLKSADLRSANLEQAQLNLTNLSRAKLSSANLDSADLSSASLYFADLRSANLESAHLNYAELNYADLFGASLDSAHLNYADLSHADLFGASLDSASLDGADLKGADLSYANLEQADLNFANLEQANLYHANLEQANLIEVQNLTPAQIKSACYWSTAIYRGQFDRQAQNWLVDEQLNQQYIKQLKQDRDSNPQHLLACPS